MGRPTKNEALLRSIINTLADAFAARMTANGSGAVATAAGKPAKARRNITAEGRARMAAAAKRRWARVRKEARS